MIERAVAPKGLALKLYMLGVCVYVNAIDIERERERPAAAVADAYTSKASWLRP